MKRYLTCLCVGVLFAAGLTIGTEAAASAATVRVRLVRAIAAETRSGYERSKFRIWVDADNDCRDTRDEVLAAESLVRVTGCDVQPGKWRPEPSSCSCWSTTSIVADSLWGSTPMMTCSMGYSRLRSYR